MPPQQPESELNAPTPRSVSPVKERVFSGIQPTGAIHIGNYLGAIRNWVDLQERYESFVCIVDYHAITAPYDAAEMPRRIFEAAVDIMAAGVEPQRTVFFVQSYVPEHTELCWVFNSLAYMGELERMTQFKEKTAQYSPQTADRSDESDESDPGPQAKLVGKTVMRRATETVNAGVFDYPVLQAADILLYKAGLVPVGEDQLQHLELSRDVARRFNHRFGETFPEPKPALTKAARIMALNDPTRKMSKSIPGSFISLADEDDAIRKKIARAVTDVGPQGAEMSPGVKNLFTLLEAFAPADQVTHFRSAYEAGNLRYSELKPAVADAVVAHLAPIRARRAALLAAPEQVEAGLRLGADRAGAVARATMDEVREKMGLRRRQT